MIYRLILFASLVFVLTISGCCQRGIIKDATFEPENNRPVYVMQVGDSDELGLIQQRFKIQLKSREGSNIYFYASESLLDSLKEIGYTIQQADVNQVEFRVVKVFKKGTEEEILKTGIRMINREKDHWIIRGNLIQLQLLSTKGYSIKKMETEVRPRQVEIKVKDKKDIQYINDIGVDIFNSVEKAGIGFIVYGAAFDYQIDLMKSKKYEVIIKQ